MCKINSFFSLYQVQFSFGYVHPYLVMCSLGMIMYSFFSAEWSFNLIVHLLYLDMRTSHLIILSYLLIMCPYYLVERSFYLVMRSCYFVMCFFYALFLFTLLMRSFYALFVFALFYAFFSCVLFTRSLYSYYFCALFMCFFALQQN